MVLRLGEAASALGVSRNVLTRWARQGKIPAHSAGGEFVFSREELESWAASHKMRLNPIAGTTQQAQSASTAPSVVEAMRRGGLHTGIRAEDAPTALREAVARFPLPEGVTAEAFYAGVMEREQLASTGVGRGVAIPHMRTPLSEFIGPAIVATCLFDPPVDFGAIDGQPVFAAFLMLTPSIRTHLALLSQLSYCLHDEAFLEYLHGAPDPDALLEKVDHLARAFERRNARKP